MPKHILTIAALVAFSGAAFAADAVAPAPKADEKKADACCPAAKACIDAAAKACKPEDKAAAPKAEEKK
ncbi:MAG: hypothetical protein L6R48_00845 [Planctomycetes bacterium]|nr:hypothetical protein [Planctomycetota bacterium]